jgi:hypothetical protein
LNQKFVVLKRHLPPRRRVPQIPKRPTEAERRAALLFARPITPAPKPR